MSWSGPRGFPGAPGLELSDYKIIALALDKYTSDTALTVIDAKEAIIAEHLIKELISWLEMKEKLDALENKK
jgi:hypothetical protein